MKNIQTRNLEIQENDREWAKQRFEVYLLDSKQKERYLGLVEEVFLVGAPNSIWRSTSPDQKTTFHAIKEFAIEALNLNRFLT